MISAAMSFFIWFSRCSFSLAKASLMTFNRRALALLLDGGMPSKYLLGSVMVSTSYRRFLIGGGS